MTRPHRIATLGALVWLGCQGASAPPPTPVQLHQAVDVDGGLEEPTLTTSRLVRRIQLSLLGRPPTVSELDAIEAQASEEAREAAIAELIANDLQSVDFYRQSMKLAHDWFRVGAHNQHANISHGYFTGHLAIELHACAAGTLHAGALGLLNSYVQYGDPRTICDDPAATVNAIQPWWDAGRTVQVIGRAGSTTPQLALRQNGLYDCGVASVGDRANLPADGAAASQQRCGCGPNLVYCMPPKSNGALPNSYTFDANKEDASRRMASEEVSRLFAHLAWYDRPLSDFLVGNYTVAPLLLKHMYVRAARFEPSNAALDDSRWWDPVTWTTPADPEHTAGTPLAWHEVVVETLHPNLLSLTGGALASGEAAMQRTAKFDPRSEPTSSLKGIPAAGALTSLVAEASFSRERVRAARWLESLTCRTFIPPPPTITFNEFKRDPATEGNCQHCHVLIDPAAVFFKRWNFAGSGVVRLGGYGKASFEAMPDAQALPFVRWLKAYDADTVMTPATAAQVTQNPDARFIDFLPPEHKLFGTSGDGTYGPLGFGKILLESGEFDRCAARQLYERFVGPKLDPAAHDALIEELRARFVANDRKVRPFVRELLSRPEFRKGL